MKDVIGLGIEQQDVLGLDIAWRVRNWCQTNWCQMTWHWSKYVLGIKGLGDVGKDVLELDILGINIGGLDVTYSQAEKNIKKIFQKWLKIKNVGTLCKYPEPSVCWPLLWMDSLTISPPMHNAWFMVSRGILTSISVPVKGFFSNFECELLWGVVQLGQDHGAPLAPCSGAQECTGCAQSAHFPQLFCLLS